MRQFTDDLEMRLREAAQIHAARGRARRAVRALATTPRPVGAVAILALAAALAAILVAGSGGPTDSALAFPVLEQPSVDASHRPGLQVLRNADADLAHARTFSTPGGPGYVATAPGGRLCLTVPDPGPDSMAGTCRPIAAARAQGLVLTLVAGNAGGRSSYVAVLPAGAPPPRATYADGRTRVLPMTDRVVVARFTKAVRVATTVNGRTRTVVIPLAVPKDGPGTQFFCHGSAHYGSSRYDACGPEGSPARRKADDKRRNGR